MPRTAEEISLNRTANPQRPAMEYPIKGFIETSFSDWPGKVSAVLFLPACNYRCRYCHNHGLVLEPEQFPDFPLGEIKASLRKRKGWVDGVCITGGEPTLHPWLASLIRELRFDRELSPAGHFLPIKLDTNGSRPEILQALLAEGLLDYVAMDLKGPLQTARYSAISGVAMEEKDIIALRSSIELLLWGEIDAEFRTTVVPTLIGEDEIYEMAWAIRGARRYTLQNFSPNHALAPELRGVHPLDPKVLQGMQERVNEIIKTHSA